MTTLVTGASGFLGRLLVRRLLEEGHAVRVLERRPTDAWDGLAVDRAHGDVTDRASLDAACAGVERVFNLAGVVDHREVARDRLMAVNVGGVEHVLAAAAAAGAGRVVHVSSIASIGFADDPATVLDEESPYPDAARRYPYALSKRLGHEAALAAAAAGQDVVVACPGFVIGAGDVNAVSTHCVAQYLRGALRTLQPGGLSYVDARDVADGLVALATTGASGRAFILGTPDGNLDHPAFFRRVGEIAGRRRRTVTLPSSLLVPFARLGQRLHVPLPLPAEEIDSSQHYWYGSTKRAMDELGYRPRPVDEAIEATVRWLADRP